jgi:hypothetical protein
VIGITTDLRWYKPVSQIFLIPFFIDAINHHIEFGITVVLLLGVVVAAGLLEHERTLVCDLGIH